MNGKISAITVLLGIVSTSICFAAPTLSNLATANVGATTTTMVMQSSETGTGYFTLLTGSSPDCGSSAQVKAGKNATDTAATYSGSLLLTAATEGSYTVRNLSQSTAYKACFTADGTSGTAAVSPIEFTTTAAATLTFPGWSTLGIAGFSGNTAHFTALAFAPDGTPYVAYVDANDLYSISVMDYNGSAWNLAGSAGFAAGSANPVSLAFAPDGALHLSFVDATYTTQVMKFNGIATWTTLGTGLPADTDVTSLGFAPDGTPLVAYIDGTYSTAQVMTYSGGGWTSTAVSTAPAATPSLAIAPNGARYLAYADYANGGKATVMQYNGADWTTVGSAGFSAGTATGGSLAIAPDGTLYLGYQDGATSGKATVMQFSGGSWSLVGDAGFSAGTATNISLAIAPDGKPTVAYQDGANSSKITVKKFNGTSWDVIGNSGLSAATATSAALAFSPNGTPMVAYSDGGNGSKATVMQLINLVPNISGTPTTTATVGVAYSFTPQATYTDNFSYAGTLPPGLIFSNVTGALSGKPTTAGTYSNIVITAHNSTDSASLPEFSIVVADASATGTVKIGENYYADIVTALTSTNNGTATLQILASITLEGVDYSGSGVITLEGGYNDDWSRSTGLFSPLSSLTITSGALIIDRITVQ